MKRGVVICGSEECWVLGGSVIIEGVLDVCVCVCMYVCVVVCAYV